MSIQNHHSAGIQQHKPALSNFLTTRTDYEEVKEVPKENETNENSSSVQFDKSGNKQDGGETITDNS